MKLSMVIPARNEAGSIQKTVITVQEHLDQVGLRDFEMIVVDDGSKDDTYAVVEALTQKDTRVRVVKNTGLNGFGRAIRFGLQQTTGEAIIILMADLSDSPQDIVTYYNVLRDEADCVFGSRFMRGSTIKNYPRFKLVINRLANLGIRLLFGLPYNDTTNAFKGYRSYVIAGCQPLISPHFNLTIEIPLKAVVRGYSYKVVPISWRNRETGKSQLNLKEQGSRYLYTLLTVWFEWLLVRKDTQRPIGEQFVPYQEQESQA